MKVQDIIGDDNDLKVAHIVNHIKKRITLKTARVVL